MLYAAALDNHIAVRLYQSSFTANSAVTSSVRSVLASELHGDRFLWLRLISSCLRVISPPEPASLLLAQAMGGVIFVGTSGIGSCYVLFDKCNATANYAWSTSYTMVEPCLVLAGIATPLVVYSPRGLSLRLPMERTTRDARVSLRWSHFPLPAAYVLKQLLPHTSD